MNVIIGCKASRSGMNVSFMDKGHPRKLLCNLEWPLIYLFLLFWVIFRANLPQIVLTKDEDGLQCVSSFSTMIRFMDF